MREHLIVKTKLDKEQLINNDNIFIIHRRDDEKLHELKSIIQKKLHLNPIVLEEQPDKDCKTDIEKFEHYAERCAYAIALFTRDDQVDAADSLTYLQTCQNVIFELGWFYARLGENKVMLLLQEGTGFSSYSNDIKKKKYMADISEKWMDIREELIAAGILMKDKQRHVFLSYSREDMAEAEKLEKALASEGLSVWIDREDIQSGSWKDCVADGLNRSRALVLLLTSSSLDSESVRKELAFAAGKKVPIIPVQPGILEEEELPDWFKLDYQELHRHHIESENYSQSINKIAQVIRTSRESKRQ